MESLYWILLCGLRFIVEDVGWNKKKHMLLKMTNTYWRESKSNDETRSYEGNMTYFPFFQLEICM